MKRIIAAPLALAVMLMAMPAAGGVTITEQRKTSGGAKDRTFGETVWVQGNKRKVALYDGAVITDLDAGKMYQLDLIHKRYTEASFPPAGQVGEMFAHGEGMFDLKKTGASHKFAGYSCDDYTGSIKAPGARYTTTECVSSTAPGANEFTAFRSAMAEKLKTAKLTPATISIPPGIPLKVDSTTEMLPMPQPKGKKSHNEGVEIQQKLAKNPRLASHLEVSKIEVSDLPPATFAIAPNFKPNLRRVSAAQAKPGASATPTPTAKP
jgi:hypothetical protein